MLKILISVIVNEISKKKKRKRLRGGVLHVYGKKKGLGVVQWQKQKHMPYMFGALGFNP